MTSIAFGLGVLPLALNKGAGSGSQNAIGTGIVGGAITTTLLGLFFVPLYFVTVLRFFKVKPTKISDSSSRPRMPSRNFPTARARSKSSRTFRID
jgi:hypothetical protein